MSHKYLEQKADITDSISVNYPAGSQYTVVGDTIEFTNRTTSEKITVKVENLHIYPSFNELYKHFDKISMGYREDEEAKPSDMEKYYTKEEQKKYGVVGIQIRR